MEHAGLTRELIAHAKRKKRNLYMVQIDLSNGSVSQSVIEYKMGRMGIPETIISCVMDIHNGCPTVIMTPTGTTDPIPWTSGTVQGRRVSPALCNICLEPFLRCPCTLGGTAIITFTWSGPRGVAGYTEANPCARHVCQPVLSDPQPHAKVPVFPKYSNHVGTIRGSFETIPAGPDRVSAIETWRPAATQSWNDLTMREIAAARSWRTRFSDCRNTDMSIWPARSCSMALQVSEDSIMIPFSDYCNHIHNNIYAVGPRSCGWLHRGPRRRRAGLPCRFPRITCSLQ
jgi:hypothetical protein